MIRGGRIRIPSGLDPVPTQIAALSPEFYFRMGETGGANPVDTTGNKTAALTSGYTWDQTGVVFGDSNTALLLSGGTITFSPTLGFGSLNQSRVASVKTTDTDSTSNYDGDPAMTVLGDSTPGVWDGFGIHDGKVQYRRFNNSVWQTFTGSTSVNDGNWHQIGMTYNSTTRDVILYVDGADDGGGTMSSHQNQGGISAIGRGYNVNDNFRGTLDEVAASATLWTAQNFADLWNRSVNG